MESVRRNFNRQERDERKNIIAKAIKCFKGILSNPLAFFSQDELAYAKFVYPVNNDTIRRSLLGESSTNKLVDYFTISKNNFMDDYYRYADLLVNGELNPRKPYRLRKYYVKNLSHGNLDVLIDNVDKTGYPRNWILIGEKGSGKTATQNCWLHKRDKMMNRKGVIWVRCDAHKLYRLWLDIKLDDKHKFSTEHAQNLLSVQDYLNIQFVYVMAKYVYLDYLPAILRNQISEVFERLIFDINKSNLTFNFPMGINTPDSVLKEVADILMIYHKTIWIYEKDKPNGKVSYAFEQVMRGSMVGTIQREKRRWLSLSYAIQKFAIENGYYVLLMVDGIDNVQISDRRTALYYDFMVNDVRNFIRLVTPASMIKFAVMRGDSYNDVMRGPLSSSGTSLETKPSIIKQDTPLFRDVLLKRHKFFNRKNSQVTDDDDSEFSTINSIILANIGMNVNEMHHNNVRAFLHNKLSLTLLVYYRCLQKGRKAGNCVDTVKLLDIRNKYLNGRLFLNTYEDYYSMIDDPGQCCLNPFYFNIREFPVQNIEDWPGLCTTRILQLLKNAENIGINSSDVEFILFNSFNYPKQLIEISIANLRTTDMIDVKAGNDDGLYYTISLKGVYHLEHVYSDFDALYYFALDSAVPDVFVEKKFFSAHSNKLHANSNYIYSSVITAVSFIAFICFVAKKEGERIKKNPNADTRAVDVIELPIEQFVSKSKLLRKGIRSLRECDPPSFERFKFFLGQVFNGTYSAGQMN